MTDATDTAGSTESTQETAIDQNNPQATPVDQGKIEPGDTGATVDNLNTGLSWGEISKHIAGDDEGLLKQLSRYTDINKFAESYKHEKQLIRNGLKKELPDDPTEEQLSEWRQEMGIPSTHADYPDPEGMTISDEDKALIDIFKQDMHALNAPPNLVQAALGSYYKVIEEGMQTRADLDAADKEERDLALLDMWGADRKTNLTKVNNVLSRLPESVKDSVLNARGIDGGLILNKADVMQFFADIESQINPHSSLIPNSSNPAQDIQSEIDSLEATMAKGIGDGSWDKDLKSQARLRELYEAQEKLAS